MPITLALRWFFALVAFAALACHGTNRAQEKPPAPVVIRLPMFSQPRTLDPHVASDSVSMEQCCLAYEAPLKYAPFGQGVLEPCLLASMPGVSKDGLIWTLRLREDIWFADSDVFADGKGRKATANDLAWSLKRLAALSNSGGYWMVEGKILGLDAFVASAGVLIDENRPDAWLKFLDTPVTGLTVVDESTLRITLVSASTDFICFLASSYASLLAPEAAKKGNLEKTPVGTGPFVLRQHTDSKLVWVRNPNYRTVLLLGVPGASPLKPFEGKKLPLADELQCLLFDDEAVAGQAFLSGDLHMTSAAGVIDHETWTPEKTNTELLPQVYAKAGARLNRILSPALYYMAINHKDPVIGTSAGDSGLALRKALALSVNRAEVGKQKLTTWNDTLTLPGMSGHVAELRLTSQKYDPEKGRELLKAAGFSVVQVDGNWVTKNKAGAQVEVTVSFRSKNDRARESAKALGKCFQEVGVLLVPQYMTFAEFLQQQDAGTGQVYDAGWVFDFPQARNVMALLYGPNKPPGVNTARFENEEFDQAYRMLCSNLATPADIAAAMSDMYQAIDKHVPWILTGWTMAYRLEARGFACAQWDWFRACNAQYYALADQ